MEYLAPGDLGEALDRLARGGVKPLAGGTDFYPARPPGPARETLLDITRIEGLRGLTQGPDGWRIGAATRWSDVIRADLPAAFDGLKAAARQVGSVQIQNAGTVGGNLVNASPAADGVPALMALEAEVELASARGARRLPLGAFITGVRQVDLAPEELVVAVHLPPPPEGAVGAFQKLGSREFLVISIAMVSVVLRVSGGVVDHAAIAVGACSPVARRLDALERDMLGRAPGAVTVEARHLDGLSPIDDVRGSGAYRLEAVAELIARAIRGAIREAADG